MKCVPFYALATSVALLAPSAAARAMEPYLLTPDDGPESLSLNWTPSSAGSAPAVLSAAPIPSQFVTLDEAAPAPASGSSEAELAKKVNNPISDLISLPLQYNADFGIGPNQASKSTLNIQPVIPISISQDWNVISRTIIPIIYAASPASGISSNWGLGDTTQSFFFSPKKEVGGWILGAGPVLLFPTATDTSLGSGKWGAGPTAVALRQDSGWTYGVLANHLWSYAGDGDRSAVNATFVQPFLSYTLPTFTTLGINSETTYDWTHHQFSIPLNLTITQILKIDKQPVSIQLGGRYYAEGPSGGPEWGVRFVFTFLFPK